MSPIYIMCGFPCCGKTIVGARLAERLKVEFIDTDRLIEKRFKEETGKNLTCRQIFLDLGSEKFRKLEKEVIFSLKNQKQCVISTGGGAILDQECAASLKLLGTVIYLETSYEVILERMQLRGIPAYLDENNVKEELFRMLELRHPLYKKVADIAVNVARDPTNEVVCKILEKLSGQ